MKHTHIGGKSRVEPSTRIVLGFLLIFLLGITACGKTIIPDEVPTQPVLETTGFTITTESLKSTLTITTSPTALPSITATPIYRDGSWMVMPVVPQLGENGQEIFLRGLTLGNDPHAFTRGGDCASTVPWFLSSFDKGAAYYRLGAYEELQNSIDYFAGSFDHVSVAAYQGFAAASVLSTFIFNSDQCQLDETPLICEYRLFRPAFAIIALGTNGYYPAEAFEARMRQILDITIERGIVPILATKADNNEGDQSINNLIGKLAYEYDIPLWNFWLAVQDLPGKGLNITDVDHLTWNFNYFDDPQVLLSSWPVRNLTALQVLESMRLGTENLIKP
jgi:hypothetical protein